MFAQRKKGRNGIACVCAEEEMKEKGEYSVCGVTESAGIGQCVYIWKRD